MKKIFKLLNSNFGFTIIELLVSVFIIATITGIFLANYHSTNKRQELIMAAQKMASDIRLAQNYALGAKEFNGNLPAGGWGVYFSISSPPEKRYIIFADIKRSPVYCDQCFDGPFNEPYSSFPPEELFSVIHLPEGITVNSIAAIPISGIPEMGKSEGEITFLPPDPTVFLRADGSFNYNVIQIELTDGDTVKTVEVNSWGLVDVID